MSITRRDSQEAIEMVDSLIQVHFEQAQNMHGGDPHVAPFSAADKLHLANRAGVDLELVERRLLELCEQMPRDEHFEAVPRYRLKGANA